MWQENDLEKKNVLIRDEILIRNFNLHRFQYLLGIQFHELPEADMKARTQNLLLLCTSCSTDPNEAFHRSQTLLELHHSTRSNWNVVKFTLKLTWNFLTFDNHPDRERRQCYQDHFQLDKFHHRGDNQTPLDERIAVVIAKSKVQDCSSAQRQLHQST